MNTTQFSVSTADARILIIDDDDLTVRLLTNVLEKAGYPRCHGLSEPERVIAELPRIQPDLILLDWHMEKMSGLEVVQALQQYYPRESMPPIVVLTGDACPETREMALTAGVSDFLTKPIDQTEALLRIRNLLRMHRLHLHVQSENLRLEELVEARTSTLREKIDELKDLQQQVIGDERMRALATMAGGVAHDFNNVLSVIRGYSELYALQTEDNWPAEETAKTFEIIALAARDGGEIVRRLREFHRPYVQGEEEREATDLNTLVQESIQLARPKWETQTRAHGLCVAVQTELGELPIVAVSASEIREVMINLIFNAVDAMPQGGQIVIRTRVEGSQVVIEVEDSGTGMTEETRRRCLEPFYSTKGERGTGLGLAITYGILHRHDATLRIVSELNRGTCLTIALPINAEARGSMKNDQHRPVDHPLRILVVDDDPLICEVLRGFLEVDGHVVTVASNGCEGLEKFHAEMFDLVITDRVMPKMSGDQLAAAIREIKALAPIILLTGFSTRKTSGDVSLLVDKPVSFDSLRGAIGRVMAA